MTRFAATNQPTVTVTGTTVGGARVDLFVNESTTSTTVVAGTTGAFSASVTLAENDDNDLQVFATTHAGNGLTSSPTSAVIAHDSVAPSLTFQAPPAGTHVRQTITVTAQASDADGAIESLTLRAAGQPLSATVTPASPAPSVTASASWDTTLTADGAQTLAADAIDHAGNTQSATRAVIVDNTPPDTTIAGGPSGDTQEPSATFTFTGSDNLTPAGSSLAKSSDGSLRVVAAATAALRRFPEGSDPAKADVVRPLIDGLSHDSVSVRSAASLGLRQALDGIGGGICFGATDSLDRRAAAIRQWEEWWNRNRKELARDRVVQRFW